MAESKSVSNEIQTLFGERLKQFRLARDLTREALAKLSGMSANTIAKMESGDRFPSSGSLEVLATALNKQPHEFFQSSHPTPDRETFQKLVDLLQNEDDRALKLIHDVAARILKEL